MRAIILEQVDRLLAAQSGAAALRRLEAGEWPEELWEALEGLGLPLLLVPEELGGIGLGWADAAAVWQVIGRYAAPAPVAECMLANGLAAAAGIAPRGGLTSFGQTAPFGRFAAQLLLEPAPGRLALHAPGAATPGQNIAREPRDAMTAGPLLAEGVLPNSHGPRALRLGHALLRAALIAGAVEHALALAVDWANTRKQFGRALATFQAIQQQLAVVASEAAAVSVAVSAAARAVDARGLEGAAFEIACAKVVAGEAAQTTAATIHQVFAAIGITEDHELHHTTRRLWSWRDEGGSERAWAGEIGRNTLAQGSAALWPDITARDIP
jgi:acyl-CoA dehydrogenase